MLRCAYAPQAIAGSFYSNNSNGGPGSIHYCSELQTLFTLNGDFLCALPSPYSSLSNLLGNVTEHPVYLQLGGISVEDPSKSSTGDGILAFTLSKNGEFLITSGSSYLLHAYKVQYKSMGGIANSSSSHIEETGTKEDLDRKAAMLCKEIARWKGPASFVISIAVDNEFQHVAAGAVDGTIKIYSTESWSCSHTFTSHASRVATLRFHPKCDFLLVSALENGEIRIWDLKKSVCIALCKDHMSAVSSIEFVLFPGAASANIGAFISCGRDKIINLWDMNKLLSKSSASKNGETHGKPNVSSEHNSPVLPVIDSSKMHSLKPSQQLVANEIIESAVCMPYSTVFNDTCDNLEGDGYIEGNEPGGRKRQKKASDKEKMGAAASWVILTVGESGKILVWNPLTKSVVKEVDGGHGANKEIHSLFRIDSNHIATVGTDGCFAFWSLPGFSITHYFLGRIDDVISCHFIPTMSKIATDGISKRRIAIDDDVQVGTNNGKSPTNHSAALLCGDERIYVMQLNGEFSVRPFIGHTDVILCCDASPSGDWLASGSKDEAVRLWHSKTASCVATLKGHDGAITSVSIQKRAPKSVKRETSQKRDKRSSKESLSLLLASAGQDLSLKVWKVTVSEDSSDSKEPSLSVGDPYEHQSVGRSYRSVIAHKKDVNDTCISPNDQMVATASQDKTVKLWSFPELELLGVCNGHARGVWSVRFSPIEKVVASASADLTIKIWNAEDFTCLKTLQGHTAAVLQASFLPEGAQMLSCGADGLIKLWNIRTSECVNTFEKHDEKIWCLDVTESNIISGGADGRIILWNDISAEVASRKAKEKQEQELHDTAIQQLVINDRYTEALTLSLELNRVVQSRLLFERIAQKRLIQKMNEKMKNSYSMQESSCAVTSSESPSNALNGVDKPDSRTPSSYPSSAITLNFETDDAVSLLKLEDSEIYEWVDSLSQKHLNRLFEYIVRWNSVSKVSWLASSLMHILTTRLNPAKLLAINGFTEYASSFLSYTTRHESRIQTLLQKSFLLDLLLGSLPAVGRMPRTTSSAQESIPIESSESLLDIKQNRKSTYQYLFEGGKDVEGTPPS